MGNLVSCWCVPWVLPRAATARRGGGGGGRGGARQCDKLRLREITPKEAAMHTRGGGAPTLLYSCVRRD